MDQGDDAETQSPLSTSAHCSLLLIGRKSLNVQRGQAPVLSGAINMAATACHCVGSGGGG